MRIGVYLAAAVAGIATCSAQGVEDIFVETYAVTPAEKAGEDPLITYRIYVDLAPGYSLQMVYGDRRHRLKIGSTAPFFNDTARGAKFADRINGDHLNSWPLALDTWLTIGSASDIHVGVPKHLDRDGSVLECPPYPDLGINPTAATATRVTPLCIQDGLERDSIQHPVADFKFASGYLDRIRGDLLETTDGAWASLGGRTGATEENMVLIAQISTTGRLNYMLNLQVAGPDGVPRKYVAGDPAEGEILSDRLTYPRSN